MALNSKTLFEAIVDANDQAALGSTYNKWLLGLFSDEVRACWELEASMIDMHTTLSLSFVCSVPSAKD